MIQVEDDKKLKKVFIILLTFRECGFLSNNQEATLLTDEKYQNKVAKAICSGTLEYLSSLAEKSENKKITGA